MGSSIAKILGLSAPKTKKTSVDDLAESKKKALKARQSLFSTAGEAAGEEVGASNVLNRNNLFGN